jgi:hypothetical protein
LCVLEKESHEPDYDEKDQLEEEQKAEIKKDFLNFLI